MKNKISWIKDIFITRMTYSAVIQFLILALIFIVLKNYIYHNQFNSITNDLIITDSFTTEEIAKFKLLNDEYALDLELHNISDSRKLDSINFTSELKIKSQSNICTKLEKGFITCKASDGFYFGLSPIKVNNRLIGYVITKKKFNLSYLAPISYGLLLILFIVTAGFLFNFFILFVSIKNKIEKNTKNLIKFISNKDDKNGQPYLTFHEHKIIADNFISKKEELENLQKDKTYYQARKNVAEQVAHDIRSPIAAINTAISNVTAIPEDYRLIIRNASNRINDIANNLLTNYKNDTNYQESISPELLFIVLDNIISEKRFEYKNRTIYLRLEIEDNSYRYFSNINPASFKRVLSNLINNSVEAIRKEGTIIISLGLHQSKICITIQDNGCGIPQEIIPEITKQGFSHKKSFGAGLGLSYAKQIIGKLNGQLEIESQVNIGTKVRILLLPSITPKWFCETIEVIEKSQIVVLDDDPSIHQAWKSKLKNVTIISHTDPLDLTEEKIKEIDASIYFIDYELIGNAKTGIEVIKNLNIITKSILVTSSFEDKEIRLQCENLNLKIIPKSYVPHIPISYISPREDKSLVLVDNDEMIRFAWTLAAKNAGINIYTFSSPDDFNKDIKNHHLNTEIYIDSELDDNIKGEDFAKDLSEKGFTEIYLTTGHSPSFFTKIPWIKAILGKEPPFMIQN